MINPIELIMQGLRKRFIQPLQYRGKGGYDAGRYWRDRFAKYGFSMQGVGLEGHTHAENLLIRGKSAQMFKKVCWPEFKDFSSLKVLEVGCGNGYYPNILNQWGVRDYTGVDITDILFGELKGRFPAFRFIHGDISEKRLTDKYDLIIMMDVIQHIVSKAKLDAAMRNIKNAMKPSGLFIILPVSEKSYKHMFHVHQWSQEDIKETFADYRIESELARPNEYILKIRKP